MQTLLIRMGGMVCSKNIASFYVRDVFFPSSKI